MFSLLKPKKLKSSKGKYKVINNPILILIENGKILIKSKTSKAQIILKIAVE